jgi:plastocyanin
MKSFLFGTLAVAGSLVLTNSAQAQKWADLEFTVVLDGKAPEPKLIDANSKDKCNADPKGVVLEDLVVNPANNGIANLVFTIDTRKTKLKPADIHPDLRAVPSSKAVLDNVKCQFIPHVMAVRVGQTIEVKNSDSVPHNAKFSFFENEEKNPVIPAGTSVDIATKSEEKAATKVDCNIHPWMNAYVLVYDHPYVGISDANGKIKIEKLPAGVPIDFKLWHESQDKSIEELTIGGKKETWKRGSTQMTLKEGKNDLGVIKISVDRFKK